MMQPNLFLILSLMLALFIAGCETDPEIDEFVRPQIQVMIAPALAQQAPTKVEISVTDLDGTRIYDAPRSFGERGFIFDIEIVPGEVTIAITMTYEDGSVVTAEKHQEITPEKNIINFSLDPPNQLTVGIDSDESFPVPPSEEFSIYLYIQNTEEFYSGAVRLGFDEDFILPVDITPAGIWGEEGTEFIWFDDLANRLQNELNVAWTRLRSPVSVHERTKLVHVKFKAKQPTGTQPTMITFRVEDRAVFADGTTRSVFRLKTQDGEDVNGLGELKATIVKRAYPIHIR